LLSVQVFFSQMNSRQSSAVKGAKLCFLGALRSAESPVCSAFARDALFDAKLLGVILDFLNEPVFFDVAQLRETIHSYT
jgi:hypothetical protein